MCEEFSCLFLYDGRVLWNLTHSHSGIAKAAGLKDETTGTRRKYLKIECKDLTFASIQIDEPEDLPSWYEDQQSELRAALESILKQYADYKAKRAPLDADYKAKCAALYADYKAKCAPLDADYEAKCAALDADYKAKCAPLDADYEAKCAPLDADYEAKCAAVAKLISGYIE